MSTPFDFRILYIIDANPKGKNLLSAGEKIFNANISQALNLGYVRYAPGRYVGFALTEKGKKYISENNSTLS
jgi:hypothetical protein